jgi:hypothetical protein
MRVRDKGRREHGAADLPKRRLVGAAILRSWFRPETTHEVYESFGFVMSGVTLTSNVKELEMTSHCSQAIGWLTRCFRSKWNTKDIDGTVED